MRIFSKNSILVSSIILACLRIFTIPIDDYPDIFHIYQVSVARSLPWLYNFLDLEPLFRKTSCLVVKPNNILDSYLFGGHYSCTEFPISLTYLFYNSCLTLLFVLIIYCHLIYSRRLLPKHQIILIRCLFFVVSIPSTFFFLLAVHTDVPYHFLSLSFMISFIYLAFTNNLRNLPFIYLLPFLFISKFLPDNQSQISFLVFIIFLLSWFAIQWKHTTRISHYLRNQSVYLLRLQGKISLRVFTIFLFTVIFFLVGFNFNEYILSSVGTSEALLSNLPLISKVSLIYSDSELLSKYPLIIRIFGTIIGFALLTPFGFGFSIFTNSLLILSLFIGFFRVFSLRDEEFPLIIKTMILLSLFSVSAAIAILPTFSYYKYWLFLTPLFCLLLAYVPRLSLVSIGLMYIEYLYRSPLFNPL